MAGQQRQAQTWDAGVPTAPDVQRLMETWPSIDVGNRIGYAEVADVIGVNRQSCRFRTVTAAWRKRLEAEQNIILGVEPNVGYVALSDSERVDLGVGKVRSAGRATNRAGTVVASVDREKLPPDYRARADHVGRVAATILGALRTQAKELRVELRGVGRITENKE